MAWLALYVPALPLQAFSRTLIDSAPVVVFDGDVGGRRSQIVARNRSAARLGIHTGATLAEANALSNALVSLPREVLREQALLQRMAVVVSALTPNVHISDDYGLMLEVSGSLALFGGESALISRVQQLMATESLRCRNVHCVVAPTARGARWLARAHRELVVTDAISDWLDELALDCTDLAGSVITDLNALNLHTLAAIRRLPVPALNQRFGEAFCRMLDEAYGDVVTTLPFWVSPRRFDSYVEFTDLAREASHWLPGVDELLLQLEHYLTLHASATPVIGLTLREGRLHCTELSLQAAHAMHLAREWSRLLAVKLERHPVPHEVSRIELRCEQIEPMQFDSVDLFDRSGQQDRDWSALGALLRLRLGQEGIRRPLANRTILPESVQSVRSVQRVESVDRNAITRGGNKRPADTSTAPSLSATDLQDARPTWFEHPARRLSEREISALAQTIATRQPERLQEDWSQPDRSPAIQRDYYVASTSDHRLLWIYRERPGNDWFLQGVFG